MYPTKGTLLNISQLFTDSKHINMEHTKSFFSENITLDVGLLLKFIMTL